MARRKLSKNAPCPCESGRKYKLCCHRKGIEYLTDDDGNIYRAVPRTEALDGIIQEQLRLFKERFGREPGPDDRLFFDAPPQEHLEAVVVAGMKKAGINPAVIYAYEKTGLIISEDNRHLIPEADLAAWQAAIEEFERRSGG